MRNFVLAINTLGSNVWAVALVLIGVVLILKGHNTEGSALLLGSFGVFRSEANNSGTNRRVDDVDKTVAKS
jgi:hypothetical protein